MIRGYLIRKMEKKIIKCWLLWILLKHKLTNSSWSIQGKSLRPFSYSIHWCILIWKTGLNFAVSNSVFLYPSTDYSMKIKTVLISSFLTLATLQKVRHTKLSKHWTIASISSGLTFKHWLRFWNVFHRYTLFRIGAHTHHKGDYLYGPLKDKPGNTWIYVGSSHVCYLGLKTRR